MAKKKVRKWIAPHQRKGAKKKVRGHYRTINKNRKLRPTTLSSFELTFNDEPWLHSHTEIAKKWEMRPDVTKKYLKELERKGKIKKKLVHGKEYWESK